MLKSCIITTEGINLRRGYVLKEMSIYLLHLNETKHYFFKSPINVNMDSNDMKTNWYTKKYLSGIGVNDFRSGSLENFSYMDILRSLNDHRIYVVGNKHMNYVTALFLMLTSSTFNTPHLYIPNKYNQRYVDFLTATHATAV